MDEIDLSGLPESNCPPEAFVVLLFPTAIERLNRLFAAIGKWRDVADKEYDAFCEQVAANRNPEWDKYGYDPMEDEAFMLFETERVMLANLAVTIASTAETLIVDICEARGVPCHNKQGQTDFNMACQNLGKSIGVAISGLPGYAGNQRARIIGNCFKHNDRQANEAFVERFGGKLGEPIEYEKEDWPAMILATKTLGKEIIKHVGT